MVFLIKFHELKESHRNRTQEGERETVGVGEREEMQGLCPRHSTVLRFLLFPPVPPAPTNSIQTGDSST